MAGRSTRTPVASFIKLIRPILCGTRGWSIARRALNGASRKLQELTLGMSFSRASIVKICVSTVLLGLASAGGLRANDKPVQIVALGDSLTAGFGLAAQDAFPAKLEAALRAKGHAVKVVNAGVSGDTASGGLGRLDWSVAPETDAVIVELGANDALRGIDPKVTREALDTILRRLKERNIPVLVAGMRAPRNLGEDYERRFNAIYPELAGKHGTLLYPFFLEGVATEARLNQRDGLHPTAEGVDAIVRAILPKVEELVRRAQRKP
jgi:acyl-CoA thioesterase-1